MSKPFLLKTDRLLLRPHQEEDWVRLVELDSDPEVVRYTGDAGFWSESEAKAVIQRLLGQFKDHKMGRFLVTLQQTGEYLGWAGLRLSPETKKVDLGYRLLRRQWGKGYATEASRKCLEYGFNQIELDQIVAHADSKNLASVHVLKKLGFRETGYEVYEGQGVEGFVLNREDWTAQILSSSM